MKIWTAALIAVLLLCAPASAHENYPPECCGGGPNGDCEPVFGEAVTSPQGAHDRSDYHRFLVRNPNDGTVHEYTIPAAMGRPSMDERYHACWPKYAPAPRCFFIPTRGA
jgi:hypothetical protein